MEIGSGPSIQPQIDVLKKAEDVQEQAVTKLLDDSSKQLQEQEQVQATKDAEKASSAALTGLGTGLDITA